MKRLKVPKLDKKKLAQVINQVIARYKASIVPDSQLQAKVKFEALSPKGKAVYKVLEKHSFLGRNSAFTYVSDMLEPMVALAEALGPVSVAPTPSPVPVEA